MEKSLQDQRSPQHTNGDLVLGGKSCAVYDTLGALLGRRGSDKHHFLPFCPGTVANPGNHPSHRTLEAFCAGVLADFPHVCLIASGAGEPRTKGQVWEQEYLI